MQDQDVDSSGQETRAERASIHFREREDDLAPASLKTPRRKVFTHSTIFFPQPLRTFASSRLCVIPSSEMTPPRVSRRESLPKLINPFAYAILIA